MGLILLPLLKTLAWLYALQPPMARSFWGRALGDSLRAAGIRAKVVRQNLEIAFPGPDGQDVRERLFIESYRHLGKLALEIFMLLGPMRDFVLKRSELRGHEHWKQAHAKGKGIIFLSNHVGNWEVMAATGALHGGMDLMIVTKHLKPEWLHRAIEAGRLRCGVRATYEPRTLKDVLRHLGANGTVGFVLDQYAGPPVGIRVPVFGVPVGTSTALATLARRTGATILPVLNYRTPEGRFIVEIRAPLTWKGSGDANSEHAHLEIAENTALYAQNAESDILAHPEQWLWIHRRFKGDLTPLRDGEWQTARARH